VIVENKPNGPTSDRPISRQRRQPRQPYLDKIIIQDTGEVPSIRAEDLDNISFRRRQRKSFGTWVLIGGFGAIIAIGTLLLKLPFAAAEGVTISWSDAIFTATSATTVTGLTVRNTALDFSFFGQIIILLLLQIGGVGFVSFSVLLLRLIGRRVTLETRFLVQKSLGTEEVSGVLNLALYVLGITILLEGAGALLLWLRWRTILPEQDAIWYAIFHAISSYCNAGFDLFGGTDYPALFGFGTDIYSLTVMAILIVLGSFGITVMYDLRNSDSPKFWALNTRITIISALILTVIGTALFMTDKALHSEILGHHPWIERFSVGLFSIISARTAGLTIIPIDQLTETSQVILLLWMFIGGAPASMAGGVTTSTVGVLLVAVIATARGHTSAVAFHKTLPSETIAKAVAIMTVSTILVAIVTLLLSFSQNVPIFSVTFEAVSAFANAGYSIGATSQFDDFARYLLAFTMFWGRLGPLTIVVALAQSEQPTFIRYPEEPVILG
jgi:trk system potassium uptake protein